jgi:ribosome-binding factor A
MKKKPEFSRARRVGELIQRDLATLIPRHMSASALGLVTIAAVDVSPDLRHAKVYFTVLGNQWDIAQVSKYLNAAAGELRHYLAQRMSTRVTPDLHFIHDTSIAYGNRLGALIDSVAPSTPPPVDQGN